MASNLTSIVTILASITLAGEHIFKYWLNMYLTHIFTSKVNIIFSSVFYYQINFPLSGALSKTCYEAGLTPGRSQPCDETRRTVAVSDIICVISA